MNICAVMIKMFIITNSPAAQKVTTFNDLFLPALNDSANNLLFFDRQHPVEVTVPITSTGQELAILDRLVVFGA